MSVNRTAVVCAAVASLAMLGTVAVLRGGPLEPPAGPVASTLKTLAEVEPRVAICAANTPGDVDSLFKITQPGSYYLPASITGVVGKHGIEIAASGVHVDLMGFTLQGVPGSLNGLSVGTTPRTGLVLVGGVVREWGGLGVECLEVSGAHVRDVHAQDNGGIGLLCGDDAVVESCIASGNGSDGISCADGSAVLRCAAGRNAGAGIALNAGSTARDCQATDNGFAGISGVLSTIIGCVASQNAGAGFATAGCIVSDCVAASNTGDGIESSGACRLANNACRSNGLGAGDGAGIHVIGTDVRVEGNMCSFNDRGIDVDAVGNIIIRNTCSGNTTNWDIVAGNAYGPIVATPAGAAVSGNTAAAALGSTDPSANFTY